MKYIEIILILMVVGSSVASWIVKTLKEQSEARRAQASVERARESALRTGRNLEALEDQPVATPASDRKNAEERLREIMIERQRRIDELRRRAQAEAQARARSQPPGPGRRAGSVASRPAPPTQSGPPGQGDVVIIGPDGEPRRVRGQAPAAPAARQRMGGGAAADERVRQERQARQRAEQDRARDAARAKEDAEQAVLERQTAASMAAEARRAVVIPGGIAKSGPQREGVLSLSGVVSPSELRRAIVLNEVLSAPRALRADQ